MNKSWFSPLFFVPYISFYHGGLDADNYRSLLSLNYFGIEVILIYVFSQLPEYVAFRFLAAFSIIWYLVMFHLFVHAYVQNKTSRQFIFLYNFGFPFGAIYAFSSFRQFVALGFVFLILILFNTKKFNSIFLFFPKIFSIIFSITSHITVPIVLVNIMRQYTIFVVSVCIFMLSYFLTDLGLFTSYLRLETSSLNFYGIVLSAVMMSIVCFLGGYDHKVQLTYLLPLIIGCILSILGTIPGVLFLRVLVYILPFMLVHVFKDKSSRNRNSSLLTVGYVLSVIWVTVLVTQVLNRDEFYFNIL